jgi:hypothetical protein
MAKYNPELEAQAKSWLEAISGDAIVPTFQEGLKDGRILCKYNSAMIAHLMIFQSYERFESWLHPENQRAKDAFQAGFSSWRNMKLT